MSISDSLTFNIQSNGLFNLNYSKDTIQRQCHEKLVNTDELIILNTIVDELRNNPSCLIKNKLGCVDCPWFILKIQYNENIEINSDFIFPIPKCYKSLITNLFLIAQKYCTCSKDSTFNYYYNRVLGEAEKIKFIKPKKDE